MHGEMDDDEIEMKKVRDEQYDEINEYTEGNNFTTEEFYNTKEEE